MKYSKLVSVVGIILLVGVFMVSGVRYVAADTLKEGDATETVAKGQVEDEIGGAADSDVNRSPDGIMGALGPFSGGRGINAQIADLERVVQSEDLNDIDISQLLTEIRVAAEEGSLGDFIKVLENGIGEDRNLQSALQKVLNRAVLNFNNYADNQVISLPASAVIEMEPGQRAELYTLLDEGRYVVGIIASDQTQVATIKDQFAKADMSLDSFLESMLAFRVTENTNLITVLENFFDPKMPIANFTIDRLNESDRAVLKKV